MKSHGEVAKSDAILLQSNQQTRRDLLDSHFHIRKTQSR